MIMDYSPGKNLEKTEINSEKSCAKLFAQLLEGVDYLHGQSVCHRDIKPQNLFVSEDESSLKIIDFNAALRFESSKKMMGKTGEPRYSAPELSL